MKTQKSKMLFSCSLFGNMHVRFYLDLICFYFLFGAILLQLQVILFQEQIFQRLRLGAKEI